MAATRGPAWAGWHPSLGARYDAARSKGTSTECCYWYVSAGFASVSRLALHKHMECRLYTPLQTLLYHLIGNVDH